MQAEKAQARDTSLGWAYSPAMLAVVFVASLVVFTYFYHLNPYRPGVSYPGGYWGWFDQGVYLHEARLLAAGHLPTRPQYLLGLGYPVFAVPMIKLGVTGDPFAVPDALAFASVITMTAVLGARLRGPLFGIATTAAVAVATPMLSFMTTPWNNTVALLAVTACLVYVTSPSVRRLNWADGALLGGLLGLCFAARYVDVVFAGAIAALVLLRRANWRALVGAAVVGGVIVGAILVTNVEIMGGVLKTPYVEHLAANGGPVTDQSLGSYSLRRIPPAFLDTIVDGTDKGKRVAADPLLEDFPWAVLAIPGIILVVKRRHRLRVPLVVATAVSVVASAFYLSFRGATGDYLIYHDVRYYEVWFPLWGLLAAYAIAAAGEAAIRRSGARASRSHAGVAPDGDAPAASPSQAITPEARKGHVRLEAVPLASTPAGPVGAG